MRLASLFAVALLTVALPASAKSECVEQSDVVGERVCGRFGDRWSVERTFPISIGFGLWTSHVEPRGRTWRATPEKESSSSVGVAGSAMGIRAIDAVGFDLRILAHPSPHSYVGFDQALAFGAVDSAVAPTGSYAFRDTRSLDYVHARSSVVVGVRVPLGRLALRAETLLGVDIVGLSLEVQKGQGEWKRGSLNSISLLIEPRLACELWTGPWSTVSVWGGTNFVHPNDRSMGVSFAIHGRAFDGKLSL